MITLICNNFASRDAHNDLFVDDQLTGYAWSGEKVRVLEPTTGQYAYGVVEAISFQKDKPVWHVTLTSKIYEGWINENSNH